MKPLIRIQQCPGGLVHLSIGAMTVRLDRGSFENVAEVIQAAAAKLAAADHRNQPNLAVIQGGQR